jgi:lipoprotein-anchoring transpeptidase ErfK/SrfK
MAKDIQICFAVHVDAVAGWIGSYGGEDSPADISRGIFAGEIGTMRLLELFRRWGIKTSWFVPGHSAETFPDQMKRVADAGHEFGVHGYTHTFKVGDDVRADVSVTGHTMKVTRNGAPVGTLSINAGSAEYPTWNGTMAVIDKQEKVHMTSCSVGISCDKGSPDYYDLTLPWDVHLTQSGTYVHYSTGDPNPGSGSARGSHGCVHLSMSDAKWFYGQVKQGDPVTVTGSPRAKASPDNGYADFNLEWDQWLAGSASGEATTATL